MSWWWRASVILSRALCRARSKRASKAPDPHTPHPTNPAIERGFFMSERTMATLEYVIGEEGTLGFPVDQPDGSPMPLDGLSLRLVIYRAGADVIVPGYSDSGDYQYPDGRVVEDHPSIAAFDFTSDIDLDARAYRAALQISDGGEWSTLDGHNHIIDARRP